MYLHIGGEFILRSDDIIAVFDLDNTSVSARTRGFLAALQKSGGIVNACEALALPKSLVLCEAGGKVTGYLSQLAPSTLQKRARASFPAET